MRNMRLSAIELRSLAFGAIDAAYMGIGVAFTEPYRIIHIQNLTDAILMCSFDGVDDHFPIMVYGYLLLDVAYNEAMQQGLYVSEGNRLYVRRMGIPTTGSIYVTGFH